MGDTEILKRGDDLQSVGTGASHSEKAHGDKQVRVLQIWSVPSVSRLTLPGSSCSFLRQWLLIYSILGHFSDEENKDKFVRVVAPVNAASVSETREGKGPTPVQSPVTPSAALISPSRTLAHTFTTPKGYFTSSQPPDKTLENDPVQRSK